MEKTRNKFSIVYLAFSIGSIAYFFINWFKLPSYIVPETPGIINCFSEGGLLWKDIIKKCFNLRMIEAGRYRPRIGAFVLQFIDEKFWIDLNRIFKWWGGHYPLVVVCIILSIFVFLKLIKTFKPEIGIFDSFIIGTAIIFSPHFISLSFIFVRTGKILTFPFSFMLFYIFLNENNKVLDNRADIIFWLKDFIFSFVVFLILTVDEQLIAIMFFLIGFSMIESLKIYKLKNGVLIGALSLFHYLLFYFFWGRWLFERYTDVAIHKHPHNFTDILTAPKHLIEGLKAWTEIFKWFFWGNTIVTIIFVLVILFLLIKNKNKKNCLLFFYFLFCSYMLETMMISSHNIIAEDLRSVHGVYSMGAVSIIVFSVLFLCYSLLNDKKILSVIRLTSVIYICISMVLFQRLSQEYSYVLLPKEKAVNTITNDIIITEYYNGVYIYQEQFEENANSQQKIFEMIIVPHMT